MDSSDEVDKDTQYVQGYIRIRDLGFANSFLSRYLHKPGEKHLQAAGPSTSMFYDIWKEYLISESNIHEV